MSYVVLTSAELVRKSASSLMVLRGGFLYEKLPLLDPLDVRLEPGRVVDSSSLWLLALFRRRRLLDFGLLSFIRTSKDISAVAMLSNKANLPPMLSLLPDLAIVT